jgi:hypothetical protein
MAAESDGFTGGIEEEFFTQRRRGRGEMLLVGDKAAICGWSFPLASIGILRIGTRIAMRAVSRVCLPTPDHPTADPASAAGN